MKYLVFTFLMVSSLAWGQVPGNPEPTDFCEEKGSSDDINACISAEGSLPHTTNCKCDNFISGMKNLSFGKQNLAKSNPESSEKDKKDSDDDDDDNARTASFDGRMNCEDGTYTQDYQACKTGVTIYNASIVAEKGLAVKHQTDQKNLARELTQKAQMDAQTGNIQSKSFDYDIIRLEKLKGMEQEKIYFYGAEIAAIGGVIAGKWPGKQKVMAICIYGSTIGDEGAPNRVNEEAASKEGGKGDACGYVVNAFKDQIFFNSDTKTALLIHEGQLAQKLIAAQMQAAQYGDQIAHLRSLKDSAFVVDKNTTERGYVPFCETNPNHQSCTLSTGRPAIAGFGQGSMNFESGSGGAIPIETGGTIEEGTGTENNSEISEGLEQLFGGAEGETGGGGIIDAPKAAKFEPGTGGGAAGGGGGGGGGSASAPGLTPESEAGTGKKDKKDLQVASYNPYGGKKNKGFRIYGGGSKKGSKYAPKGLLGQLKPFEKKRGVASLDIADKDIGLFKKISGRYARLSVDKRIASPEKTNGKSKK